MSLLWIKRTALERWRPHEESKGEYVDFIKKSTRFPYLLHEDAPYPLLLLVK